MTRRVKYFPEFDKFLEEHKTELSSKNFDDNSRVQEMEHEIELADQEASGAILYMYMYIVHVGDTVQNFYDMILL